MFPFIGARTVYGRAVRSAADGLLEALGERADEEAWRAARLPGLPPAEQAFCQAVAELVSRRLGRGPGSTGR